MIIIRRGERRAECWEFGQANLSTVEEARARQPHEQRVTSEDEVKSWIKHFGVTREELAVELAVQLAS
jgi:hypothetical protein